MNYELQKLKHRLLRVLLTRPAPYCFSRSEELHPHITDFNLRLKLNRYRDSVVNAYLKYGHISHVRDLLEQCPAPFQEAFLKIIHYQPQLTGASSRRAFLDFCYHHRDHPRFFREFCSYVNDAVAAGVYKGSARWVANRVTWNHSVIQKDNEYHTISSNILPHYADLWTLMHPHVNFTFIRRTSPGLRLFRQKNAKIRAKVICSFKEPPLP